MGAPTIISVKNAGGADIANDPSSIQAQSTIDEDGVTNLTVTIADPDPPADWSGQALKLEVGSNNDTLLPDNGAENIIITGNGTSSPTRTVTLSPAADQHGETLITLTVKDGTDSTEYQFKLQVNSVNDAPSFDMVNVDVEVLEDAAVAGSGYTVVKEERK